MQDNKMYTYRKRGSRAVALWCGAVAVCGLLAWGCAKEQPAQGAMAGGVRPVPGGLLLVAEGSGGKTTVGTRQTYWQDAEEEVWVNYTAYPVSVSGPTAATVARVDEAASYRVVYPVTAAAPCIPDASDDMALRATVPDRYVWAVESGRQVLKAPLAGYAMHDPDGTVVDFRHLTAAINVTVTNSTGAEAVMESVTVESDSWRLSGRAAFRLGADGSVTVAAEQFTGAAVDDSAARRKVQITYAASGDGAVTLAAGASHTVQVPVLPTGSGNHFTVEVKMAGGAEASRTQTTGGALGRGVVAPASISVADDVPRFSVAADRTVSFSPGNLQYQASTGTWRFAEHQYDYIGNAAGNNTAAASRPTQASWIDLFGWGTSGWDNGNTYYRPYDCGYTNNVDNGNGYGPTAGGSYALDLTGDYAGADWGVYNAIQHGSTTYPAGTWRTLTNAEWIYLLNTRSTAAGKAPTVSGKADARWVKAKVNNISGLIIFPDEFTLPDGITIASAAINTANLAWTNANCPSLTAEDWTLMENAGAVFLPAAGYQARKGNLSFTQVGSTGIYWTASQPGNVGGSTKYRCAFRVFFSGGYVRAGTSTSNNIGDRNMGGSVRLVRDEN